MPVPICCVAFNRKFTFLFYLEQQKCEDDSGFISLINIDIQKETEVESTIKRMHFCVFDI